MKPLHQRTLAQEFNFTEADLVANRDGYMSDRQKQLWNRKWTRLGLSSLAIQGAIILGLAGIVQFTVSNNGPVWLAIIFALMGLMTMWAVGDLLNPARDYDRDLRMGHVYGACGELKHMRMTKPSRNSYPRHWYKITVESIEFRVSEHQWNAFVDGEAYCVYYLPESRTIISAEAIRIQ